MTTGTCFQPVGRDRYCARPFGHFGKCGDSTVAEHAAAMVRDPWSGARYDDEAAR